MNIEENKIKYIDLLKSINREGIEGLVNYLNDTDMFTAPASTKYHGNYEGGLCEHALKVYENLLTLNKNFGNYSEDSLKIVALLHDISKVNFYEQYDKNVKVDGKWVQEKAFKVRDDHFVFGTHENNSLFIVQQFIPLTIEEQTAILCHHGGLGTNNTPVDVISQVYGKYQLPMLLHFADMIDAFAKK